jgi:hypothetical protein
VSVAEKEGAALVTRPHPKTNDQVPSTLAGRSDDLTAPHSGPPALPTALRRVAVSLLRLASAEATGRDRELLPAEIRDLRQRVPGLDEHLGGPLSAPESSQDDYTAKQAARLLNLTRPDGSPQDSFYKLTEELGGYQLNASGHLRFPHATVDDFRRGKRRDR